MNMGSSPLVAFRGAGREGGPGGLPGGSGGSEGEQKPKALQDDSSPDSSVSNAVLPAHAQRMRSLFASDKLFAACRVSNGGLTERAACDGRGVGPAAQEVLTGRTQLGCGGCCGRGRRGAHLKHVRHGCDAGRVEAQRLVERRRVLPRRKESVWEEGRYAGPGDGRGACGTAAAQEMRAGRIPAAEVSAGQGHARSAPETCRSWS